MRKALTIAIIGAALAVAMSFVLGSKREAVAQAEILPTYQVVTIPRYERGPRIIHVPQPGEERAGVNERDDPAVSNDDEPEEAAPPPPRRRIAPKPRSDIAPKRQRRSDAPPPPPPGPPRAILSAPPPPAASLSPIRPTPRYKYNADSGDKFGLPRDPAVNTSETPTERVD